MVIGIGGSYLGARGAIELLKPVPGPKDPKVFFVGNTLSADALWDTLDQLGDQDFDVNVISKSGTTLEPAASFRIFRELLQKKYGDEADKHIFATTDAARGALKSLANDRGWESFVVPDDVGGRFSVLSAVGLNDVRNVVTIGADYDRITGGGLFYKDLLNTDYLGVPCPQFQLVSPQNQRETFLSRFNHSWFYGCVNPQLPYPSYHMDTPLIGQRMIPWMQYYYGFEGSLYYCVNMFSTSDQGEAIARDVWTDPMVGNTAGDGMLLYPGSKYKIFGPITSMRLENIRNSMEDYELFYLMDQHLSQYNANTGSTLSSCRDLISSEVASMFNGTQLLTSGHTFATGYQSQDFDEFRIYLLQRLEYCY